MKWTRTITTEVRVSPWVWVENDPAWSGSMIAGFRIWLQTDGTRWWQCHEWELCGGNRERTTEGWITSGFRMFPPHFVEPDEEPPA